MNLRITGRLQVLFALLVSVVAGCATTPPGSAYPRETSRAMLHPEATPAGRRFAMGASEHPGTSAFRMISGGIDGFASRIQMIDSADRTLDLQYYIFRGDETGRLLAYALLRAADRGVRVRLLIDDGQTVARDTAVYVLAAHPHIEVRLFNPFRYRGHAFLLRATEFMFGWSRLDYRMHNKLLLADNAVALIGGRNIGDEYFQMDPDAQLADDDLFVGGPAVQELSATFDDYWNSAPAIPVEALDKGAITQSALERFRGQLEDEWQRSRSAHEGLMDRALSGEPFAGIMGGRLPLIWARAKVLCDSPDKQEVAQKSMIGRLMYPPVAAAAQAVTAEIAIITPYFVPPSDEVQLMRQLRERDVRVRVLTNSLESSDEVVAFSGYTAIRQQLVHDGVEIYEVRRRLGNARGSGQTASISRYGNFGLHAKFFVFDRTRLFVGSMNFDQRSIYLNTEVGLLIDSPELARQALVRFDAMTEPANAYHVVLRQDARGTPHLVWRTEVAGKAIEYGRDPARSEQQRVELALAAMLPLESEL